MDKLFRYSLLNDSGDYYYLDNGVVSTSPTPVYLHDDPKDWKETQVSFTRNETSHGVFRNSSVKSGIPLRFHGDAAKILRSLFYTDANSGYLKLVIEKQNRSFTPLDLNYYLWYSCEVDLSASVDGDSALPDGDVYFNVTLIEVGISAVLDNHKDDTYEIPLYLTWTPVRLLDPVAVQTEIGGVKVTSQYDYMPVPGTIDINFTGTLNRSLAGWFVFEEGGMFELASANEIITIVTNVSPITGVGSTLDIVSYEYHKFKSHFTGFVDVNVKNTIRVFNNNLFSTDAAYIQYRIIVADTNRDIVYENIVYTTPPVAIGAMVTMDVDFEDLQIPISESDRLYLFVEAVPNTGTSQTIRLNYEILGNTTIYYSNFEKYAVSSPLPFSLCHGFRYKTLAQKILNEMADGSGYTIVSDLLDSDDLDYFCRPSKCVVVPAASLRQLDNPKIKTSLRELLDDLKTMFGIGWAIEGNNLRIEKASYFYRQDIELTTIPYNSTVQKTAANEYVYNRIKIGFKDNGVDEINGLEEFCCEHEYNCGLTAPSIGSKELDLVSPYIHGIFGIETIRTYLFRSDSQSIPTDNDTCVIEVENFGTNGFLPSRYPENGTTSTSGIKYPDDVYNVGHSPKACLIRNLAYIKSYLKDGQIIKFNTATKNSLFEYEDLTVRIFEGSDIEITFGGAKIPSTSDLYDDILRFFLPYIFEYKGEVPENLLALMETADSGSFKKYGVITINDNGVELKMFALDIGVNPGNNDTYQIRGLCSPDVSLQDLIR